MNDLNSNKTTFKHNGKTITLLHDVFEGQQIDRTRILHHIGLIKRLDAGHLTLNGAKQRWMSERK